MAYKSYPKLKNGAERLLTFEEVSTWKITTIKAHKKPKIALVKAKWNSFDHTFTENSQTVASA